MSTAATVGREDCWCTSPVGHDPVRVDPDWTKNNAIDITKRIVTCRVRVTDLPHDDRVETLIKNRGLEKVMPQLINRVQYLVGTGRKDNDKDLKEARENLATAEEYARKMSS